MKAILTPSTPAVSVAQQFPLPRELSALASNMGLSVADASDLRHLYRSLSDVGRESLVAIALERPESLFDTNKYGESTVKQLLALIDQGEEKTTISSLTSPKNSEDWRNSAIWEALGQNSAAGVESLRVGAVSAVMEQSRMLDWLLANSIGESREMPRPLKNGSQENLLDRHGDSARELHRFTGLKAADEILKALADPFTGTQDQHGVCAAEVISNVMILKTPAEWVRMASTLMTKTRQESAAAGFELPKDFSCSDFSENRAEIDARIHAAIMQKAAGLCPETGRARDGVTYSNELDSFIENGTHKPGGISDPQAVAILDSLVTTGQSSGSRHVIIDDPEMIRQYLLSQNFSYVALRWDAAGQRDESHAVGVTRVDEKRGRVYFRNPHGKSEYENGQELTDPPRRVEDATTGIESMSIEDFFSRVEGAVVRKRDLQSLLKTPENLVRYISSQDIKELPVDPLSEENLSVLAPEDFKEIAAHILSDKTLSEKVVGHIVQTWDYKRPWERANQAILLSHMVHKDGRVEFSRIEKPEALHSSAIRLFMCSFKEGLLFSATESLETVAVRFPELATLRAIDMFFGRDPLARLEGASFLSTVTSLKSRYYQFGKRQFRELEELAQAILRSHDRQNPPPRPLFAGIRNTWWRLVKFDE